MNQPRMHSGLRLAVPVAVAVLLGAAGSTLLVLDRADRSRLEADATVRETVAEATARTSDSLRTQIAQAVIVPTAADKSVPINATSPPRDRLIEARDGGAPILDDTGGVATVIVPVFLPGLPAGTTEDRRRAIAGYRVVPLAVAPILTAAAPDSGGVLLRSPAGKAVARTGPTPSGARTYSSDLALTNQPGWELEAWVPGPSVPTSTWFEVAGIALAAILAAVYLGILQKQRWSEARRSQDLERQRTLVTGLAPVVQTSLDLAEVVPALSTHLVEGLGLRGVGLSVPTETGERQLFTWGQPPDHSVPALSAVGDSLGAGETYMVPLTRGGRVLGLLRVVAGEPLGHEDLQSLTTASELLGSTLANAEAFARQQVLVDRMKSVDELKTIFLATASHELRTPVTAIVGFSGILLHQQDTLSHDQSKQFLERVLSNAKGLEALIEQLLDFSRLERGMHPVGAEELDLGARVQQILDQQPSVYDDHELLLSLSRGCTVQGSPAAIERIVTNLVGNAAKYSPAGTTITVAVRREMDRCLLIVDDEGPGVPAADRDRVFSRFFRGSNDTVASTRGAGIGLAIVAEYASSMSATASVLPAPSGGARFLISFPMSHGPDPEGAQHVLDP